MDTERNKRLLEEYKKLPDEELEKMENDLNISYNDYVIVALARALKEDKEEGLPLDEAFREILGEDFDKYCAKKKSFKRFGWNK